MTNVIHNASVSNDLRESSGKQLKHEDLLQYSSIFGSDFNKSELHDRILVLRVEETLSAILPENCYFEVKKAENGYAAAKEQLEEVNSLLERGNQSRKLSTSVIKPEVEVTQKEVNQGIFTAKRNFSQERRLFIHSSWLAVQSSYFRALLYSSGMKESSSKEIVLKVAAEELVAHYTLINAMYQPSILDDLDPYDVLQVLILANKYDVSLVFKKCKYVLMSVVMSLRLCESILLIVIELVGTDDLIRNLQKFLVDAFRPLDKFWLTDEFKNLSDVSIKILLSCDELSVVSENTVFVALMSWCKLNDYNGPSLLFLIRPESMTLEFLQEVVYDHYLARQMEGFYQLLVRSFRYHSSSPNKKTLLDDEITKRVHYEPDNDEPSFTWLICLPEDIHQNSPEVLNSDHFWWCGFEMMLSLTVKPNLWSVYLYVLNIDDVSCLNFVWVIEAEIHPPEKVRRQVTFRNRFDLGYDKTEFTFSRDPQNTTTRSIKIFIRFAVSY